MIRIEPNQPTKRNNARLMLTTVAGGALGAAARYVIPTQNEIKTFGETADTFFSNAPTVARGANRSIAKYAGVGAVVAAGLHLVKKALTKNDKPQQNVDTFEYSKYAAIIDAPEYACEILLYKD